MKRYRKKSSRNKKNYRSFSRKKCNKVRRTRKTGGKMNDVHIIKLWASWCGHCVALNDVWPEVISGIKSKNVMFHDVESADMEGDTSKLSLKNKELGTNMLKIMSGYPTLLKMKNNVVTNYEGGRDKESLIKWINL
jgi:thiol-disulfide isomerase/thioredoxin